MSIVKFELNETQLALQLRSTLEQADSCYAKEYLPFAQANAKLSDNAFVDTLERQFAAKLLYVAWQGVRWNLDCYRDPINKLRLQTDYEELHGEYLFFCASAGTSHRRRHMFFCPAVYPGAASNGNTNCGLLFLSGNHRLQACTLLGLPVGQRILPQSRSRVCR